MTARARPPDLSVAVFAYDEAENVGPVLTELQQWLARHEPRAEIVVVDDGSHDGTGEAAERALRDAEQTTPFRVLRHEHNRGIGAALKTAVQAARGEWVTFLPADGQIPPAAIGTLRAAGGDGVDVVFSVYDRRDDGVHRTILSFGIRALIRTLHGVRIHSDGPYLFRRRLFDPRQLASDSFFLNFEFPIRAMRAGLAARTVTVECRPRRAGHSKSTALHKIAHVGSDLLALRLHRFVQGVARARGRDSSC